VVRDDGTTVRVVIAGRRSSEGDGRPLLHWELQERGPATSVPVAQDMPAISRVHPSLPVLANAMSDIAAEETLDATLDRLAGEARTAVSHADEVGVLLARSRGRVETPAATGDLARACDELQNKLDDGPWRTAVEESHPVLVSDVGADARWPEFGRAAADLGVGAVLAVPLVTPRGIAGTVNFYARATDAFDTDDEVIGAAFGVHAGVALAHAELEANLRVGLRTREEIGRAVGILMERHRITAKEAFDLLVVASQHSHRKLRDIAAWMAETGEDPTALLKQRKVES
jgi:GAF domain-containing protein